MLIPQYNLSPRLRKLLRLPLILLFLAVLMYTIDSIRWTPPLSGGIARLVSLDINGHKQHLLIRGHNPQAPILLFLHGNEAQLGIFRKYQENLEKDYIVVQWDRRGTGLSADPFPQDQTLTLKQNIQDALTVTAYLKEQFNQKKIYLAAHSSGTGIGWFLARDYPEHFYAYAAFAQMAGNNQEAFQYKYTLQKARSVQNNPAASVLEQLGAPPWTALPSGTPARLTDTGYASSLKVREQAEVLKGLAYTRNMKRTFAFDLIGSTEYRLTDALLWRSAQNKLMNAAYAALAGRIDLSGTGAVFQIPFYMFLGEEDLAAPYEPSANLYERIQAPAKDLIIYRQCAHYIMWERTLEYQAALKRLFNQHQNKSPDQEKP